MRIAVVRERYLARNPRRGETLLLWPDDAPGRVREETLHPSLAAALAAARVRLRDPRCRALYLYDGRRLYDRQAIERAA